MRHVAVSWFRCGSDARRWWPAASCNRDRGSSPTADDRVTTVFESFFVRGENIATPKAISAIRTVTGLDGAAITAMIDDAVGSPFVVDDGEGVFGADRLPQIAWRLARARPPGDPRP